MQKQFKASYQAKNVKPNGQPGGRVCGKCGGKIHGGFRLYRPLQGFSHLTTCHVSSKTCQRITD